MDNSKAIIITTINPPSDAVKQFAALKDYSLFVAGDAKTPKDWECPDTRYISLQEQLDKWPDFANVVPLNSYPRKMFAYLEAFEQGVKYLVESDDDNYPQPDWGFPDLNAEYDTIQGDQGFINVYQLFTERKIWPRGLPLTLINTDFELSSKLTSQTRRVGVWQGLADADPDVDAVYRLTNDTECYFDKRPPVVLDKGTVCPFNTQNTFVVSELFPLLYLPVSVSFRYTDILKGLVAQPIMWAYDYHLGFVSANVVQERNEHDIFGADFLQEIEMYKSVEQAIDLVSGTVSASRSITDNLRNAYETLQRAGIVQKEELTTLDIWLRHCS